MLPENILNEQKFAKNIRQIEKKSFTFQRETSLIENFQTYSFLGFSKKISVCRYDHRNLFDSTREIFFMQLLEKFFCGTICKIFSKEILKGEIAGEFF